MPFFAVNEKSATDVLPMNTMQTPELEEATFYNDLPQRLKKPGYCSRMLPATGTHPCTHPCWSAVAKITLSVHARWSCGIPFVPHVSCTSTQTAVLPRSKNCTASRRVRCSPITRRKDPASPGRDCDYPSGKRSCPRNLGTDATLQPLLLSRARGTGLKRRHAHLRPRG